MDNLSALKALYVAVGGELTDTHSGINGSVTVANYTLLAHVIAAIAAKISAGSMTELPSVTSSNNGQVLTVVSGKWKNADLPS